MGWNNPPVPWREFERRLSWRQGSEPAAGEPAAGEAAAGESAADSVPRARPRPPARTGPPCGTEPVPPPTALPRWAELHCHSSYSFLDGASEPTDLIAEAARLGLAAIAITDHDGMYGVPQFAQAAARLSERTGVRLGTVFGAELNLAGAPRSGDPDPGGRHLLVLARDSEGYRRLCQVISDAHLAGGEKGRPAYDIEALARAHGGHWVVLTGCRKGAVPAALTGTLATPTGTLATPTGTLETAAAAAELHALTDMFGQHNVVVELIDHDLPDDDERNDALLQLARRERLAVVATNNVHYAAPADAKLAQALAAIRARASLDEVDGWLAASGAAY